MISASDFFDFVGVETDMSGRMLTDALVRAERNGQFNVPGFLRELPGEQASIDLSKVAVAANRLKANQKQGFDLAKAGPAAMVTPSSRTELKPTWTRQVVRVSVTHRSQPIKVLTLVQACSTNGRLVVISLGLRDDPESFVGWDGVFAV